MTREERIVELVSEFINEHAVMTLEDWDNILLQVEEEENR